jgi:hypothetical protein
VYGTLTSIDELPVDFFPLDSDVISMELDNVFKVFIYEPNFERDCLSSISSNLFSGFIC